MSLFWIQYKAVLWKSLLINLRSRDFIKELISVIIISTFIIVTENFDSNNYLTPFYMSIAVGSFARYVAMSWVSERQTRQKQLQKIMGLSQTAYILGWLTYYLINGIFVTLVMTGLLAVAVLSKQSTKIQEGYNGFHIFLLYVLYSLATVGFAMMLSTFFTVAKTATQGVGFIQLLSTFIFFIRFSQAYSNSYISVIITSIFPQQAFNLGISCIAFRRQNPIIPNPSNYNYQTAVVSLIIDFFFYFGLSLYLDAVWPNQIGTNKHPLFFLRWIWTKDTHAAHQLLPLLQEQQRPDSSAKYEQFVERKTEPVVKISNSSKYFGNYKAVDEITLNFYEKEIFCLLGHNGAGKSTMINLLTGMLKPTSGQIELLGMNYANNLSQIRQNIGLCLQYNVLYDFLTIQDHLLFYSNIKGRTKQQAKVDIENIIDKCALGNERGKLAKNLSGGNKRKLCLANALIGGSKLIFLDEPSSGLDPNSRQAIWDIMKKIKNQNKCIILTTHHLEEAEQLSQRIGIMSSGKLVIVGDNSYIKSKFNVGFHLTVSFHKEKQHQMMQKCREIVNKNIKGTVEDDQTALNTLKFVIPENQIDKFSKMFREIEEANFDNISFKMSSLQDAFVKLGTQQANLDGVIPQIPDVQLPQIRCKYNLKQQFKAIFIKKRIVLFRSISSLFSLGLPAIFICMGVLVSCFAIQSENKKFQAYFRKFILAYFMVWAFVFNTSAYCGSIVIDREKRFKYLSNVMGLRTAPYWMANYAFDIMVFCIPLVIFFILVFSLSEAQFLRNVIGYVIISLLLFCLSFISYSYLFSFVFQKSNTAFRLFPIFNFIFFYILPQLPQIISPKGVVAQYICPLASPFIAFSSCFTTKQFLEMQIIDDGFFLSQSLTYNLLVLVFQAIIYFSLTIFLERIRFSLKDRQVLIENDTEERQEQQRLIEMKTNRVHPIYVEGLYKKYPNGYVAIKNNSFSVDNKEIFGLLGPNGAGKSTTFNIITAALPKTSGQVRILGEDVNRGMMDIFQNVGVCPQYDAIYQSMTTEEHLQYFARLKGLSEQEIQTTLQFYYGIMSLGNYVKVQAGKLSGGNKRKLCVVMAMLANPSIMFLDEPSAGVDPISRRYLWKSLSLSVKKLNTAMVLTTHSMNEAQSLCSRIGILIKGRFVALDTPKNLTLRYGKGFRIEVLSEEENHKKIIQKVKSLYEEVQVHKEQANPESILFVIASEKFSFSESYQLFHNDLLKSGKIKKYNIAESNLQEVFLYFSRMQPQVIEENYREPWQCCCWEWGVTGCQCML